MVKENIQNSPNSHSKPYEFIINYSALGISPSGFENILCSAIDLLESPTPPLSLCYICQAINPLDFHPPGAYNHREGCAGCVVSYLDKTYKVTTDKGRK